MSDPSFTLCLPAKPSLPDLEAMRRSLVDHADQPVTISASTWRRFDSLTLQFLVAVQADWRARGLHLAVTDLPEEMEALFRQIGLQPDQLGWEAAA